MSTADEPDGYAREVGGHRHEFAGRHHELGDHRPELDDRPDVDTGEHTVSRRVLLGVGLGTLGVLGGGAVGFALTAAPRRAVENPVPPADVLAALDRERSLIESYDAAVTNLGGTAPQLRAIAAEHQQHFEALTALLPPSASSGSTAASSSGSLVSSSPSEAAPTPADLVAAETAAATAARQACLAGNGTAAVLLAVIAASESSHAQVLA